MLTRTVHVHLLHVLFLLRDVFIQCRSECRQLRLLRLARLLDLGDLSGFRHHLLVSIVDSLENPVGLDRVAHSLQHVPVLRESRIALFPFSALLEQFLQLRLQVLEPLPLRINIGRSVSNGISFLFLRNVVFAIGAISVRANEILDRECTMCHGDTEGVHEGERPTWSGTNLLSSLVI